MVFLLFPHCKRKVQKCVYTLWGSDTAIHPPENFAKKRCFKCKASRAIFWPLPTYKELKLTTKPFTGCTLGGLLIPMQNISFQSSGMCRKQNFYSLYFFILLSLLSWASFTFLASFFSFAGHFGDRKSFGENFKDLRIRRKER